MCRCAASIVVTPQGRGFVCHTLPKWVLLDKDLWPNSLGIPQSSSSLSCNGECKQGGHSENRVDCWDAGRPNTRGSCAGNKRESGGPAWARTGREGCADRAMPTHQSN